MSAVVEPRPSPSRRSALVIGLAILALTVVAVLAAAVRGSTRAAAGPYGQFVAQAAAGPLVAGSRVGQTFIADQAGLYRIDVYLSNGNHQNHGLLVLHVKAAPFVTPDLATASVDAAQLTQNGFVSFEFAPLREPAGLPLSFWLEAPPAQTGSTLTVLGAGHDLYLGGAALFDGLPADGVQDLAFRLYYQPGLWPALTGLMQRQAASRPAIFGQPQLYLALFGVYLLGLAGLLVLAVVRLRL